jgi:murein L,D-transpeptidase YafK
MAVLLGGCPLGGSGGGNLSAALKQLPAETQVLLAKQGMTQEAPILVRIFKEESQLEVWKEKPDGRFYHFKTYPICTWSGELGPKVVEGDKQAPEGFYTVTPGQMNPNSQFHLSFNLGYPNSYDKVNGRTGGALMVHGDCRSAGCFAMTDALIEEIYALGREAFRGGQEKFHVHAFPFRMTEENMKRHRKSKWYGFWKTLKIGYDDFELTRKPPNVAVCSRQYLVNAEFLGQVARPDPASNCPAYRRVPGEPFTPFGDERFIAKAPDSSASPASRVAAYNSPDPAPTTARSTSAIASPAPASSASEPQRKASTSDDAASDTVAPRPVVTTRSIVEEEPPVAAAEIAEQPTPTLAAATSAATPDDAVDAEAEKKRDAEKREAEKREAEKREAENKTAQAGRAETSGMHHVVTSGKGDMLAPKR